MKMSVQLGLLACFVRLRTVAGMLRVPAYPLVRPKVLRWEKRVGWSKVEM